MGKRLTQKDFDERVQNLTGNSFDFLEPFHGVHSKLAYYHVDCGHFNYIEPNSFFRGHRCPYCYGNNKKTDKEFKQEIYSICGNHYKLLTIPYLYDSYGSVSRLIQEYICKAGYSKE